jgi:hypothetical protein
LTPTEIQRLLANNTATGVSKRNNTYYAWFDPSGQVRFEEGEIRDHGTWHVLPDGQFCAQMVQLNQGNDQCYALYRDGSVLAYGQADGTMVGTFLVLSGNPHNL